MFPLQRLMVLFAKMEKKKKKLVLLNSILKPGSRTRHSLSFQSLSAGVTCTTAKSTTGTDTK